MMVCTPKALPRLQWLAAAALATAENPVNAPPALAGHWLSLGLQPMPVKERLALLTTKYWGARGVHLGVHFLDGPTPGCRREILAHMNAWGAWANVAFRETDDARAPVRIAREGGPAGGYWSYLGTDVLAIAAPDPTMNLEGFTERTPESEYRRVVRHEAGHTLGFPHEHMRRELVALIDPARAIAYYGATQGWSAEEVRQQVLTPLEDAALWGTARADPESIMAYQVPAILTTTGAPIVGGTDITARDAAFAATVYPVR